MTEIERLEAEIAERKARLSKLKKEKRRGERLCFTQLRDGLSDDNISVFLFEQAIDKVRRFVVMLARARKETLGNGRTRLVIDGKQTKIANLSCNEVEICNDFIAELIPILKKYVHLLNELEVIDA